MFANARYAMRWKPRPVYAVAVGSTGIEAAFEQSDPMSGLAELGGEHRAGEAGTVGGLAAVMNAVVDALRPLGVTHLDMPASPERIWAAIRDARAARAG